MKKRKEYRRTRFSADVLKDASSAFRHQVDPSGQRTAKYRLSVEVDDSKWFHDSLEEFYADYRRSNGGASYAEELDYSDELIVRLYTFQRGDRTITDTSVEVESESRSKIEAVFDVFERHREAARIREEPAPAPAPRNLPKVFVGHGNNPIWRDLKDHLHEQHNFEVIAYEVGARAGHEIRDILAKMLQESSFAILVMTGEDRTEEGQLQPRMNVVHELGLFQGHLGFDRAITLLERGTQEFSNINGVHQIRFAEGNIRETFGDVVATLNREFPGVAD